LEKLIKSINKWALAHSDFIRKLELLLYIIACLTVVIEIAYYIYIGSWPHRDVAVHAVSEQLQFCTDTVRTGF